MQRITDSTAGATLPAPPALTGPIGYFNPAIPGTQAATRVRYWWLTMMQEEIMSVLAFAGITPDTTGTNFTGLLRSIQTILAGGGLAVPGRLINIQRFVASATYTPTAGMGSVIFEMQGGGAPGGGATLPSSGNVSLGAPGTSGSYLKIRFLSSDIGASRPIVVGAAGVAASGGVGTNGGATTIGGTLAAAPGGIAGPILNNQAVPTANGNGSYTSAPTNTAGIVIESVLGVAEGITFAVSAAVSAMFAAAGGRGQFGATPNGGLGNATPIGVGNYGAGGGGVAINSAFGGPQTGGNPGAGIAIAYEFS
jgi:hypothetical protein